MTLSLNDLLEMCHYSIILSPNHILSLMIKVNESRNKVEYNLIQFIQPNIATIFYEQSINRGEGKRKRYGMRNFFMKPSVRGTLYNARPNRTIG